MKCFNPIFFLQMMDEVDELKKISSFVLVYYYVNFLYGSVNPFCCKGKGEKRKQEEKKREFSFTVFHCLYIGKNSCMHLYRLCY